MRLTGSGFQQRRDYLYDASGTSTGSAQLVLPQALTRSYLFLQNNSDTDMYVEFGSARATATLTSGVVTSTTITNAGFNFTKPPVVQFIGGGPGPGLVAKGQPASGSPFLGGNIPGYPSPSNVATGICHLTTGALSSIELTNGGSGYLIAPYVFIYDSDLDPYGCAVPSTGVGIRLPAVSTTAPPTPIIFQNTVCPTDPVSLICGSSSKAFVCKYMD